MGVSTTSSNSTGVSYLFPGLRPIEQQEQKTFNPNTVDPVDKEDNSNTVNEKSIFNSSLLSDDSDVVSMDSDTDSDAVVDDSYLLSEDSHLKFYIMRAFVKLYHEKKRALTELNLSCSLDFREVLENASKKYPELVKRLELGSTEYTEEDLKTVALFKNLKELYLGYTEQLVDKSLESILSLKIENLTLYGCRSITEKIFDTLSSWTQLKRLDISYCRSITSIAGLTNFSKLERLNIKGAVSLTDTALVLHLPHLKYFTITECKSLNSIAFLRNSPHLEHLIFWKCPGLRDIPEVVGELLLLKELSIKSCVQVTSVKFIKKLTNLHLLSLSDCYDITSIDALSDLPKLDFLCLNGCAITRVEPLTKISTLASLIVCDCRLIEDIETLEKSQNLTTLDLPDEQVNPWITEAKVEKLRKKFGKQNVSFTKIPSTKNNEEKKE